MDKVIGAVVTLAILFFLGYLFIFYVLPVLLVLAVVGTVLYYLYKYLYRVRNSTDDFLAITFIPMGFISKHSSSDDSTKFLCSAQALSYYDIFESKYETAQNYIEKGAQSSDQEIKDLIRKYSQYWKRPSSRDRLFSSQVRILFYDRVLTRDEINLFMEVSSWYEYSSADAQALLEKLLKRYHFVYNSENDCYELFTNRFRYYYDNGAGAGAGNDYSNSSYSSGGGYSNNSNNSYNSSNNYYNELDEAYKILGIDASTSDADARRAYKRMITKYHPDRATSKGLGENIVRQYTELTQKIVAAWEVVKKHRHIS